MLNKWGGGQIKNCNQKVAKRLTTFFANIKTKKDEKIYNKKLAKIEAKKRPKKSQQFLKNQIRQIKMKNLN